MLYENTINKKNNINFAAKLGLFTLIYFVTARIGLSIDAASGFGALIWPPSGIALATLLLFGREYAPGIFFGALFANVLSGASFAAAMSIGFGNMTEALLAFYFLKKLLHFSGKFDTTGEVFGFQFFAGMIAPIVSATIGVSSLILTGAVASSAFFPMWLVWWSGDMFGILILTPMVILWTQASSWSKDRWGVAKVVEFFTLTTAFLLCNAFVFYGIGDSMYNHYAFVYYLFIPVAWFAFRFEQRITFTMTFITACIAVFATVTRHGHFVQENLHSDLVQLDIFLLILTTSMLAMSMEVAKRKRTEAVLARNSAALEESLSELQRSDEAKNRFLAVLAHELRNPLAPVLNVLELLSITKTNDAEVSESVGVMKRQVMNIKRLLDDLLDLSRVTHNRIVLKKERTDMNKIARNAADTAMPLMQERGHRFTVKVSDLPLQAHVDPLRIEQCIVNLLNNAAKYTLPGGTISLETLKEKNSVVFKVTDTGVGLDQQSLHTIFEGFNVIKQPSGTVTGGLGIGLKLVHDLIALHGGSVSASSAGRGKGSTFTIRIPIAV